MGERFDKFKEDNKSLIEKGIEVGGDFFKDFFKQNKPNESFVGVSDGRRQLVFL